MNKPAPFGTTVYSRTSYEEHSPLFAPCSPCVAPASPDLIPTIATNMNSDGVFEFGSLSMSSSNSNSSSSSRPSSVKSDLSSHSNIVIAAPIVTSPVISPSSPTTLPTSTSILPLSSSVIRRSNKVGMHEAYLRAVEHLSNPSAVLVKFVPSPLFFL
jgi:hypothetical protein